MDTNTVRPVLNFPQSEAKNKVRQTFSRHTHAAEVGGGSRRLMRLTDDLDA